MEKEAIRQAIEWLWEARRAVSDVSEVPASFGRVEDNPSLIDPFPFLIEGKEARRMHREEVEKTGRWTGAGFRTQEQAEKTLIRLWSRFLRERKSLKKNEESIREWAVKLRQRV